MQNQTQNRVFSLVVPVKNEAESIPGLHTVFSAPMSGVVNAGTAHREPVWFYLEKLPALLPWLPLAIAGAVCVWRRKSCPEERFGPAYLIAGFTMLTLISSKKEVYLLALVPEISLLAADILRPVALETSVFSAWRRKFFWALTAFAAAGLAGMIPVAVWMSQKNSPSVVKPLFIVVVTVGGISLVRKSIRSLRRFDHPDSALFNPLLALVLVLSLGFHLVKPEFDSQRSYKAFSVKLHERVPPDARIFASSGANYALMFYSGRIIDWKSDLNDLEPGEFLLQEKEKSDKMDSAKWRKVLDGAARLPPDARHRYLLWMRRDESPHKQRGLYANIPCPKD